MSINNRQIGESQESRLWWEVLKKLNILEGVIGGQMGKRLHTPNAQIGWGAKEYLLRQIAKKIGQITSLRCVDKCTTSTSSSTTTSTTTAPPPALKMSFTNGSVGTSIPTDLTSWNTIFDLPTNGSPFTSISVIGNDIYLYGGSNIILQGNFLPAYVSDNLLSIEDDNSIIEIKSFGLSGVAGLTSVRFSALQTIETFVFFNCVTLVNIEIPVCTNLGGSVGDDNVFFPISGNTISLTVPSALMTCDAGNPDGDIVFLQTNNTVTITTV